MASARVSCPVCGLDLAAQSLRKHVGRQACLERQDSALKTCRLQEARAAKLAYNRRYTRARRGALERLALQLVERGPPAPESPRIAPPPPQSASLLPQPQAPRRPRLPPPETIVIDDDEDELRDQVRGDADENVPLAGLDEERNCPICPGVVDSPVTPANLLARRLPRVYVRACCSRCG
ncbi:hypothetical protein V7S43_003579 [Phytophthora oleae]|uniref:Uncharacterized protein n=1 Tax=Phytophthora oleae TaxID=2107226 RepID=A0ABD3FZ67_9STRA